MYYMRGLTASSLSVKTYLKNYLAILICGLFGTVASMNYVLCIFLNVVCMFILVYFYEDDFLPRSHFMYGFAFVMLQAQPYPASMLPQRILSMLYGFCVISLYLFLKRRRKKQSGLKTFAVQGSRLLGEELLRISDKTGTVNSEKKLSALVSRLVQKMYPDVVKQNGVLNREQSYWYHILLCMEQVENLAGEARFYLKDSGFCKEDENYFMDLGTLFAGVADESNKALQKLKEDLDAFLSSHTLADRYRNGDWNVTLSHLSLYISRVPERENQNIPEGKGVGFKWRNLMTQFNQHSCRGRFALKAAVLNGICFAISYYLPFSRSFWLPLTVYTTLCLYHQEETQRAATRIWGTITGMLIFVALTEFIPANIRTYVVMIICLSLICSSNNQLLNTAFGTQMAVSGVVAKQMNMNIALGFRFAIVAAAAILVWLGGKYLLRTERRDVLRNHMGELIDHYEFLTGELERSLCNGQRSRYMDEILLKAQLLADDLQSFAQEETHLANREVIQTVIVPSCHALRRELIHFLLIFGYYEISEENRKYLLCEINILKTELSALRSPSTEERPFPDKPATHTGTHLRYSAGQVRKIAKAFDSMENRTQH